MVLDGITVNAYPRDAERFQILSQRIAETLPGLWGYIGVDLIRMNDGALTVLEVNPRLTTSYCGLHAALGINVARALLRLVGDDTLPQLKFSTSHSIELNLAISHA